MLHGKHVMVRVGGGWDTLQGFLLKYDPCRVLQFATLEQKILAFQKGITSDSIPSLSARNQEPPLMNPMSAVNMFQKQPSKPPAPVLGLEAGAKKALSKRHQSPRVAVTPSSTAKSSTVRSKLQGSSGAGVQSPFKPLAGTSKKLESPACNSPASAPSQPGSKSSSRAGTRTALVPSEMLRKRIRSPDATKVKFALSRGSPASTIPPVLSPSRKQPSHLSGAAGTTASKQKCVPAKCKPVSATKTKANSVTPRPARLPVTNLHTVATFAHSQQLLAKPAENDIQISGAESQHPQKAPQTTSHLARSLKTASKLKLSASAPSLALSKASKSPPPLLPTGKNVSSADQKEQNASNPPQAGASLSKPAERTPLSVVRLPQTSAKAAVTKKPAQPSIKGQHSTKNVPTNKTLAQAAKKPLPEKQAYNKRTPDVSKVPLPKSRQDDHYFVMTGTKKPRK